MVNFREHIRDIDKDFTALYFALYMKGEWGIEVGYNTIPLYLANMRKRLADWQVLSNKDCNDELFIAAGLNNSVLVTRPSVTPSVPTALYGDYNNDYNNDFNN